MKFSSFQYSFIRLLLCFGCFLLLFLFCLARGGLIVGPGNRWPPLAFDWWPHCMLKAIKRGVGNMSHWSYTLQSDSSLCSQRWSWLRARRNLWKPRRPYEPPHWVGEHIFILINPLGASHGDMSPQQLMHHLHPLALHAACAPMLHACLLQEILKCQSKHYLLLRAALDFDSPCSQVSNSSLVVVWSDVSCHFMSLGVRSFLQNRNC